jgi:thiol-disulfide isomerase/thioredoxin
VTRRNAGSATNPFCRHTLLSSRSAVLIASSRATNYCRSGRFLGALVWPVQDVCPGLPNMAAPYAARVRFAKVNTEVEQGIAATYQIRSIPTLALFKQGKEVDRVSGALACRAVTGLAGAITAFEQRGNQY